MAEVVYKPVIGLVTCNRLACEWPEQAVDFALIIALLLQRGLNVGDHLIGWQAVIGIDRTIVSVIRIGSVAPRRVPPARIPVVPSTIYENDTVVMTVPPTPVVPRRSVIPESPIILTLPVLASLNLPVLLKLHSGVFRRTRVRRQIETLCLVFFTSIEMRPQKLCCRSIALSSWNKLQRSRIVQPAYSVRRFVAKPSCPFSRLSRTEKPAC